MIQPKKRTRWEGVQNPENFANVINGCPLIKDPRLTSCPPDEPDDLSGLSDDEDVLELGEEEGEVEGHDGQQVHEVHRTLEELPLAGCAHWQLGEVVDQHTPHYPDYKVHDKKTLGNC